MVLALLCLSMNLFGQVKIGVKTVYSMNLTSPTSKEYVSTNQRVIHQLNFDGNDAKPAIGLSLYTENDHLFFNSDILYSQSGRKFSLQSMSFSKTPLDPGKSFVTQERSAKLVVNSGLRFNDFKLGVGPEFSYLFSKEETLTELGNLSTADRKLQAGFNFLAGCILNKHLHLDLKFTYIFQDVSNEFKFEGIPLDMRKNPKYVEIGIAYFL